MGSDGKVSVKPTQRECPLGHDSQLQFYDFRKCTCLHRGEATCYDDAQPGHLEGK